jgi:hypothetical protein
MRTFEFSIPQPKEFILAGKAYFTAQSDKTSAHLTYKVTKCDDKNMYFISVNTDYEQYMFVGNLWTNKELTDFNFVKSKKLDPNKEQLSVIVFQFIIDKYLVNPIPPKAPNSITFYHHGKCARCGRKLTTPDSIKRGIGPQCMYM